jgi:glycosyltransferase involved in cell wall biosynthesis
MRYVFDISTSLVWRGRPVGIVRTEHELIKFFLNSIAVGTLSEDIPEDRSIGGDQSRIAFCHYSKRLKGYYHVTAQQARTALRAGIREAGPDAGKTTHSQHQFPSADVYLAPLRKLHHLDTPAEHAFLPASIRDALASITPRPELAIRSEWGGQPVRFEHDDVYCSFGLDWDNNNYALLRHLKSEKNFSVALCVYDLIPILYPRVSHEAAVALFYNHVFDICQMGDLIFSISKTTSADLLKFAEEEWDDAPITVKTVILGDDLLQPTTLTPMTHKKNFAIINIGQRYCLYVSTIEARKNHEILLRAWERLVGEPALADAKMVFVGMAGWGVDRLMKELGNNKKLADRVIVLSGLSDVQLNLLYQSCTFTVFPSIYEGWGLAATESLRHGKAVVVSDAPALAEATQNLMPVIAHADVSGWSEIIARLFLDVPYRQQLEYLARTKYRARSWNSYCLDVFAELELLSSQVSGVELQTSAALTAVFSNYKSD